MRAAEKESRLNVDEKIESSAAMSAQKVLNDLQGKFSTDKIEFDGR